MILVWWDEWSLRDSSCSPYSDEDMRNLLCRIYQQVNGIGIGEKEADGRAYV